jgi:hypothetical protein
MTRKSAAILPLATALAALGSGADARASEAPRNEGSGSVKGEPQSVTPISANTVYSTGTDLFGLLVTRSADGTVVAQHSSHASHATHASHSSSR